MTKLKKKSDIKNVQFKAKVEFAKVHEPETKFKKEGEYSVTLVLDTKESQEAFKQLMIEHGVSSTVFNPKTKKVQNRLQDKGDGSLRFTVKRGALSKKGEKVEIKVGDAKGNIVPKSVLIGNGSVAIVHMFSYPLVGPDGEFQIDPDTGKPEGTFKLSGLQVTHLVPYSKGLAFSPVDGEFEFKESFIQDSELEEGAPF